MILLRDISCLSPKARGLSAEASTLEKGCVCACVSAHMCVCAYAWGDQQGLGSFGPKRGLRCPMKTRLLVCQQHTAALPGKLPHSVRRKLFRGFCSLLLHLKKRLNWASAQISHRTGETVPCPPWLRCSCSKFVGSDTTLTTGLAGPSQMTRFREKL